MIKIKGLKFYTHQELLKKDLKSKVFRDSYNKELAQLKLIGDMKKARLAKKMSQRELAKKAGMTQSMIARLESGKRGISFSTMSQIASALGKKIELV